MATEYGLTLSLQEDAALPLYRQIYEQIRDGILNGRVRSQQKMPASRQLAQSLGVSRSTVIQSYDQLISEGYLHTRKGAGTFVCAYVPDSLLMAEQVVHDSTCDSGQKIELVEQLSTEAQTEAQISENSTTGNWPVHTAYGERLKSITPPSRGSTSAFSFRYWRPDLALFPTRQWQRLVNRHSLKSTDWMAYTTEPMGHLPLRAEIAHYLGQVRAIRCNSEQVLITQGTQQALGLIAQILLTAGEPVAVEEPGYLSARKLFESYGARVVPISVDTEGLQIEGDFGLRSQGAAQDIRLVYVTPSHQFPTGALMSLSRRLALLSWAQAADALVVEDDYDSEFRYGGRPVPALQGLDTQGRVLYVGTFSKVMFPGLRLGYVVLPPALVPVFERAKWLCDRQGSLLHQAALADFIGEGHLAKHIRRMRTVYERRRLTLLTLLTEVFAPFGEVEFFGDPAGLHVMARLPLAAAELSDQQFVAQARTQGVDLFSVRDYYVNESSDEAEGLFIFGFGGMDEEAIESAIARLEPILASSLQKATKSDE